MIVPTTEPRLRAQLQALVAARAAGDVDAPALVSETDLFLRLCPAPTIGVTGTKGKTTTTYLIKHLLDGSQAQGDLEDRGTKGLDGAATGAMGPGYFPTVLGSVLTLFGLWFVVKAFRSTEKIEPDWSLRALVVIPMSLVLFGVMMNYGGFVPALVVLIFGSALASTEFNLIEVTLLTIGLTIGCVAVFIWGLGLPYQLFGF